MISRTLPIAGALGELKTHEIGFIIERLRNSVGMPPFMEACRTSAGDDHFVAVLFADLHFVVFRWVYNYIPRHDLNNDAGKFRPPISHGPLAPYAGNKA